VEAISAVAMAASALSMHSKAVIFEGEDHYQPSTSPTAPKAPNVRFFLKILLQILLES